jgi:hypothetical protein
MTPPRGNARLVTALLAVPGGVGLASTVALIAKLDGDAVAYTTAFVAPILVGALLQRHGALHSRREAFVLGAFAMTLVAIVTFAVNGKFGGIVAESVSPLGVLALLVGESAIGMTLGSHLARRAAPRAGAIATFVLAMLVAGGAVHYAEGALAAIDAHAGFYSNIVAQTVGFGVGTFFTQAIAPVRRCTFIAIGALLPPIILLVYYLIDTWRFEWIIAAWYGGMFIGGWLGAYLGWRLVARHAIDHPDAIVAVFE